MPAGLHQMLRTQGFVYLTEEDLSRLVVIWA